MLAESNPWDMNAFLQLADQVLRDLEASGDPLPLRMLVRLGAHLAAEAQRMGAVDFGNGLTDETACQIGLIRVPSLVRPMPGPVLKAAQEFEVYSVNAYWFWEKDLGGDFSRADLEMLMLTLGRTFIDQPFTVTPSPNNMVAEPLFRDGTRLTWLQHGVLQNLMALVAILANDESAVRARRSL